MKDREWCKKIEDEILGLKKRVDKLEGNTSCSDQKEIEIEIEWPEADIAGLHFNEQKTRGVFELGEDGNYYSRDILLHSARDTDDSTECDLLSEYLDSEAVRAAFQNALGTATPPRVFLPKESQGVKKYNGVRWWYWLEPRSEHTSYFTYVHSYGSVTDSYAASSVGGVAPAFCVA